MITDISFFFLMIRRPPRSTLFPTRRSSDLWYSLTVTDRYEGCTKYAKFEVKGSEGVKAGYAHYAPIPCGKNSTTVEIRRSEEHTSELQSRQYIVCRLLLEKIK